MNFEEIWQQYDFTEAELLSMGWQFPYNYILNLNYYWEHRSFSEVIFQSDRYCAIYLPEML